MSERVDVLIAGAGPTGVLTALLLADLGVRVLAVDRRTVVSELPRSRGVHARATEVLRQLGAEEDMVAASLPTVPRFDVCTSLAEPPLFAAATGGETMSVVSHCEGVTISQDDFEAVLRRHLATRDTAELRLGVRLAAFEADAAGVTATLVDATSGERSQVRARFLLGADGWRSDVRTLMGIGLSGDEVGRQRSIRFRADLSRWLGSPPPVFVRFPQQEAVLLPTHADDRWVLSTMTGDEDAVALLGRVLGVDASPAVLGDGEWLAAIQRADALRAGPVFLLGDAAHRVTPAGAQGISMAVADALDLAWKLAAAVQGWAGPVLLDTYATERSPVVDHALEVNRRLWGDLREGRPTEYDLRLLEMGYRYASPIVQPTDPAPDVDAYEPSAEPGDRAPHAWLADGRSTLDSYGRGFVLVSAGGWSDAVARVAASLVPLAALDLDTPDAVALYGVGDGGAVLVRPDGHVAWRLAASEGAEGLAAAVLTSAGFLP